MARTRRLPRLKIHNSGKADSRSLIEQVLLDPHAAFAKRLKTEQAAKIYANDAED
jgi:hypothetical protein